MTMMDKLKNNILNYIYLYDLTNEDISDKNFDDLLTYYIISLGINKKMFDEFITYWCSLLNIKNEIDTILVNMDKYNLLDPYILIGEVTSFINATKTFHYDNMKYYEEQMKIDEENIKDSSIPMRKYEAYSDLAYSRLCYSNELCNWQLCQSTLDNTSAILKKIQGTDFTRKKVDF